MQIIVDADSRRLSLGPTPPVRGETIPGTLTFMKGGVPFRLPAGTAIQIGVKSWNDPSDVLLAYTTATRPEPDGAPYTFSLSLNTSEMLAKFTAGVTRYDCSIEVKWEVSAGSGTFKKTQRHKYSVDADTVRDTDANPSTMLSRNDFLVTNGTGLLVNVAAGYAANGAFVAAQASLAITNATNYIEVTAAGVASVNTTAFTAGSYPLATVVASAGAITSNTDLRAWITPKPATGGGVTSITGTANEITVTGTTTPTLSLPSALTFTGKTVTGGTFASPTLTTPTIGDGTESAPSLSFTSDTNTGVYRPAADTVGIVGGGHDILRLTDVASATDYLEIKNGIGVGSPLHVLAEGASANIGVHLQPKGSGLFTISDGTDFAKGIRFRSSSSAASAITLLDAVSTAGRVVTLPDATGTLALVSGDLGTPTVLVGTNITGTASGLTAGNATLAATVTVANEATDTTCFPLFVTAATGSLEAKANTNLTFNSAAGAIQLRVSGSIKSIGAVIVRDTGDTIGFDLAAQNNSAQITAGQPYTRLSGGSSESLVFNAGLSGGYIYVCNDLGAGLIVTGTISGTSSLTLGTASATAGTVLLKNATSTGTTTLANANTSASNYIATLPAATGTLLLSDGSGANLTALNADNISSGTLADARLSANVPLLNAANAFTANQSVTGTLSASATSTTANVKPLLRQTFSNAAATITAGNNYIAQTGTMSANRVLTLPAANAVQAGSSITVVDESGTAAYNQYIAVTRSGSNTIIGGFSSTAENVTSGSPRTFTSDGSSKWFIQGVGAFGEFTGLAVTNSGTKALSFSSSPHLGNSFRVYSPVAGVLSFASSSDNGVCKLTFSNADSSANSAIANSGTTLTFGIGGSGTSAAAGGAVNFTGTVAVTGATTLGIAGSAVGTIGFNNATSGTTTLSPATGALGSGAVTLPLSGTLATLAGTETLTNKRLTQRTGTATSSATPTINTDNVDFYSLTAQAADITSFTTNLSGTPTDGQQLWIAITGTAARAITWGATFEAGAVALPTTTVTTTRLDVAFVWNAVSLKWRCMASG